MKTETVVIPSKVIASFLKPMPPAGHSPGLVHSSPAMETLATVDPTPCSLRSTAASCEALPLTSLIHSWTRSLVASTLVIPASAVLSTTNSILTLIFHVMGLSPDIALFRMGRLMSHLVVAGLLVKTSLVGPTQLQVVGR